MCVAVCCSALQCVAVCCSVLQCSKSDSIARDSLNDSTSFPCRVWCSVVQFVAVCYSVFQCIIWCCSCVLYCGAVCYRVLQCVAVRQQLFHRARLAERFHSLAAQGVLQCVAVCCNMLQCVVAVCCSGVLQ